MNHVFYGKEPSIDNLSFMDYPTQEHCLVVFFSGCSHNCKGCHNPELQKTGRVIDEMDCDTFLDRLRATASRLRTNKISLEGGDPLHPQNRMFTKWLLEECKGEFDFIVYTGYEYEQIREYVQEAKFVKCGRFDKTRYVEPRKTDEYMQFASTNQKLYKEGVLVSENGKYEFP